MSAYLDKQRGHSSALLQLKTHSRSCLYRIHVKSSGMKQLGSASGLTAATSGLKRSIIELKTPRAEHRGAASGKKARSAEQIAPTFEQKARNKEQKGGKSEKRSRMSCCKDSDLGEKRPTLIGACLNGASGASSKWYIF
jgi:hypothetical protein